jgi:hypothetical protein
MSTEVISIRVRKEVKTTLERGGINVSEAVKDYLEKLALQVRSKEIMDRLEVIVRDKVKPSRPGFAMESVREDRSEGH